MVLKLKKKRIYPGWVAQLVGASSCTPKGCRFDSQSGQIPRLWVQAPVGEHLGGNQSMFLSHIDVCLSLFLLLSLKLINTSSDED